MKIAEKGYTVKVVSWENDGDNYRTESKTYDNKELAIAVAKMCKTLFRSINSSTTGIGNSNDREDTKVQARVATYFTNHPELLVDIEVKDPDDPEELVEICSEYYASDLLGYSEYYSFRVCESVSLYYLEQDIIVEEIKF